MTSQTQSTRASFKIIGCLIVISILLSACISTEPLSTAPHINLSPNTIFLSQNNKPQSIDFGIEVTANESDSLENLEVLPGLRVRRVGINSPAQAAKIKAGDIILAVNGTETNHPDTFAALLQSIKPGQSVELKARRDTTVYRSKLVGQTLVRADIEELYRSDPVLTRAGYQTELIEADDKPLTVARIVEVFPKSPFTEANIEVGEAIVGINDRSIESAQGFINQLNNFKPGDDVSLSVLDKTNTLTTKPIQLWDPGRRISKFSLWPLFSYQSGLSPSTTKFSLLDFWIFSIFEYERENTEKSYTLFTLFNFGTGAGELVDESNAE